MTQDYIDRHMREEEDSNALESPGAAWRAYEG